MSKNIKSISIASSFFCATALLIAVPPAAAQRPSGGDAQRPPPQEAPPPPPTPAPTRPQSTPPPPPPTRDQNAGAQQQREANARAQQQQDLQRTEKARQEQAARDQERIAKARQEAAGTATTATDPKDRDTIGRLIAAEHMHREQLARINRLKQLAVRQGQNDRVGDLDRLLTESNANFDHKLQTAKAELPEPAYINTVKMLEQGRRREVRQMMSGQDGGAVNAQPTPTAGAVQAPQRVSTPQRQKAAAPSQPPH